MTTNGHALHPGVTRGPHFVVPPAVIGDERITLSDQDAHHLTNVLRAGPGDPVSVADGVGTLYQARVTEVGHGVGLAIQQRHEVPAPQPQLRVVVGTTKAKKLDETVRQLTELGVDRIAPVVTARSESRPSAESADRAVDRWRGVAHAAAKQSRRAYLPAVEPVHAWEDAFADDAGLVCWEEASVPITEVAPQHATRPVVTLALGPEGGLRRDEVAASGLRPVALGDTILRAETAAVAAAAISLALLGRLA